MRSHELGTGWLGKMERPHKLEPTCRCLTSSGRMGRIWVSQRKKKILPLDIRETYGIIEVWKTTDLRTGQQHSADMRVWHRNVDLSNSKMKSKKQEKPKPRIWMPKARAVTMQDRRTKRKRTRQAQRSAWQSEV